MIDVANGLDDKKGGKPPFLFVVNKIIAVLFL